MYLQFWKTITAESYLVTVFLPSVTPLQTFRCFVLKQADAQSVGFDEGPVTPDSYKHLESKGMKLKFKILHERGSAVFESYRAKNPTIY